LKKIRKNIPRGRRGDFATAPPEKKETTIEKNQGEKKATRYIEGNKKMREKNGKKGKTPSEMVTKTGEEKLIRGVSPCTSKTRGKELSFEILDFL